jgi:hypothetical protein
MGSKLTARVCAYCGKAKGTAFHAIEIKGKMRSVPLHIPCIRKYREKYGDK